VTDKIGKILIVDDDEDVLKAARFFLKSMLNPPIQKRIRKTSLSC